MRKLNPFSKLPGIAAACFWLLGVGDACAQTFRAYSTPVCPGQTEVYTLDNIPTGYRLDNPTATGGFLSPSPAISSSGTATFQVR